MMSKITSVGEPMKISIYQCREGELVMLNCLIRMAFEDDTWQFAHMEFTYTVSDNNVKIQFSPFIPSFRNVTKQKTTLEVTHDYENWLRIHSNDSFTEDWYEELIKCLALLSINAMHIINGRGSIFNLGDLNKWQRQIINWRICYCDEKLNHDEWIW